MMLISGYRLVGHTLLLAGCFGLLACGEQEPSHADRIDANELANHIRILASDEFEGRAPSSPGEAKTIEYVRDAFQRIGVQPGNGDSYYQQVPLVEITAARDVVLTVSSIPEAGLGVGGEEMGSDPRGEEMGSDPRAGQTPSGLDRGEAHLAYGVDMMTWTTREVSEVALERSQLVFVGYGIVAPEYDWDDYAGVDVTGKTVVVLVNDPGYATQDEQLFTGNAMTYYGRWTYKYEEAARQGAAGVLIVHDTDAAGYPWEVVTGSWSGKQFHLATADKNMSRAAVEGWLSERAATELFAQAGMDFSVSKLAAQSVDFQSHPLPLSASVAFSNELRRSESNNVLGLLVGTERPDEIVVYMAHWDHLGRDPALTGDQIYNGAVDNATGVAGLLELAQAHANVSGGHKRSILFMAVTAEESGLLGSKHYAENPVFPLAKTIAGINMDGLNVSGETRDVTIVGYGASDLDSYLVDAATQQGRVVVPEANAEKGYYYRSDHFSLAKLGVPMLYAKNGQDFVGREPGWGQKQADDYVANRYHKPADEFDPNWDLSGMVLDTQLYFAIGARLADEAGDEVDNPNWHIDNEFRAIRDASLQ